MKEIPELHLHVRSEYFAAIKRGEKGEEYRLHNTYWRRRLVEMPSGAKRQFRRIVIHDAYKPAGAEHVITFPWRGWHLKGIVHPEFGPDEVTVFAIILEGKHD